MSKYFYLLIFFTFLPTINSQVYVEGVNINELDITYCTLYGYNKGFWESKIVITVDYGQKFKFFTPQNITGADGETKVFNTLIGALNFMENNGWTWFSDYHPSPTTAVIIMKKTVLKS